MIDFTDYSGHPYEGNLYVRKENCIMRISPIGLCKEQRENIELLNDGKNSLLDFIDILRV